ncbi:MAG: N-carbamoylputrescine amidase [Desulfobacterales bacterium]|nr:N-carbamoylputrescine amidase [Desulfobacterales bacterium]
MSKITVAATQMACSDNRDENIANAEKLIREASGKGAQIILLQELFETLYFCQVDDGSYCKLATELENNPAVNHFSKLAKELDVVLPVSFFEKKNRAYYNTVAVIDADGSILGRYRKTHIPDGFGYDEKFYFNPGNTGFKVWDTKYAKIGIGICWDQWFPETARCMVLQGAEILFYPTAIGSSHGHSEDSRDPWQVAMRGHAASNMVPVVASNRIGTEHIIESDSLTFYGSSFISNHRGKKVAEAGRTEATVVVAELDLDEIELSRQNWGFFRDRRPEMYQALMTLDGDGD